MGVEGKGKGGAAYWPPTSGGASFQAPEWQSAPTGEKGKENLGAPYWPPTTEGTSPKEPDWRPRPTGI